MLENSQGLVLNQDDFAIASEIERLNYLITASEENTKCLVSVFNEDREAIYQFNSTMFLTDQEDLELVWEKPVDVNLSLIKKNCILKIDFKLHGIQIYAECFLRSIQKSGEHIILNISGPYKMDRFQRRKWPRVGLSGSYTATVTLDKNKDYLSNLLALNISGGGVAVLVNAPAEDIRKNIIYEEAEIQLPLKMNNHFSTPMMICHNKLVNKSLLPPIFREKNVEYNWYQIGMKFMFVNSKMEQSLTMVINQVLRNNNNH